METPSGAYTGAAWVEDPTWPEAGRVLLPGASRTSQKGTQPELKDTSVQEQKSHSGTLEIGWPCLSPTCLGWVPLNLHPVEGLGSGGAGF